jgi:UDP-N-acetylglucosamine 1-carboxyvinyltransferase
LSGYIITGGHKLSGRLKADGSKNAALPILAATILNSGENMIFNCPVIKDVCVMMEILKSLGCNVDFRDGNASINSSCACNYEVPQALATEMRSSIILMGPILARFGKVIISHPGGCAN